MEVVPVENQETTVSTPTPTPSPEPTYTYITKADNAVELPLNSEYSEENNFLQYTWGGPDPNSLTREELIQYYYALTDTFTYIRSVMTLYDVPDGPIGEAWYDEIDEGFDFNSTLYEQRYTDEEIANRALKMFHEKIVDHLRKSMDNPPDYLGILDSCYVDSYNVTFTGETNYYNITLNARYGTNILDGGTSTYIVNAQYFDDGNNLICTSFNW